MIIFIVRANVTTFLPVSISMHFRSRVTDETVTIAGQKHSQMRGSEFTDASTRHRKRYIAAFRGLILLIYAHICCVYRYNLYYR